MSKKLQTKFKLPLISLVRPELKSIVPPEVQFEVFRWMLQSGWKYQYPGDWGYSGVYETMYGLSTVNGIYYPSYHGFGVEWRNLLKDGFHRALLGLHVNDATKDWRAENDINLECTRWFAFGHRTYRAYEYWFESTPVSKKLDAIFSESGPLCVQLNEFHSDAVEIHYFRLVIQTECGGWVLLMNYGVEYSGWTHVVAVQKRNEAFCDFVSRCVSKVACLVGHGLIKEARG